jgi:hypothetical protein
MERAVKIAILFSKIVFQVGRILVQQRLTTEPLSYNYAGSGVYTIRARLKQSGDNVIFVMIGS